jgi:hypothetical protein
MTRLRKALLALGLLIPIALLGYCTLLFNRFEEHFPPGPPTVSTTWETEVTLTSDRPVVARGFRVGVEPTAERMTAPHLSIGARPVDAGQITHAGDVWISIFDPATGDATPAAAGTGHATLDGWIGSGREFKECETEPCSATYVMVVRWLAPTESTEVRVNLTASLSATLLGMVSWATPATPTPVPLPEGLSVVEDPAFAFDGKAATLVARASGSARITPGQPVIDEQFNLHVPAAGLRGKLRYPTLGRVLLTVDHADSSHRNVAPWNELTGPRGMVRGVAGIALDTEWLSGCSVGKDCDVPLDLRYLFGPSPADSSGTLPPDAWAEASWTLEAHLELLSADDVLEASEFTLTKLGS